MVASWSAAASAATTGSAAASAAATTTTISKAFKLMGETRRFLGKAFHFVTRRKLEIH
jgi:hypothetical protein